MRNEIRVTEYKDIRVLTTQQIAEVYETDNKTISYNFNHNKNRYIEGRHYILLQGEEQKHFGKITNCQLILIKSIFGRRKEHFYMQNLLIQIKHGKYMKH